MDEDTIACRVSYIFQRGIPKIREHILLMRTCVEELSDRLDRSETRLTTMDALIVAQAANGESSEDGRRSGEVLRQALDEERDRLFEHVDRLVKLSDVLDDYFLELRGEKRE